MHGRARVILLVLLPSAAHSQSLFPSRLARFVGKDNSAYTGDNGPAYYAKFRAPAALARDADGNLYIAEAARIRKIDTRGIITILAPANNPGTSRWTAAAISTSVRIKWRFAAWRRTEP